MTRTPNRTPRTCPDSLCYLLTQLRDLEAFERPNRISTTINTPTIGRAREGSERRAFSTTFDGGERLGGKSVSTTIDVG